MLDRIRAGVSRLLVKTPLRRVAHPVYAAAVAAELSALRVLDSLRPPSSDSLKDITALVKTFERPYVCARLIASIRHSFPTLPIVVVDDSKRAMQWAGARTVALPYDVGISVGRNEGLRHIESELFLLLDDDHIVGRHTDIARAVSFMQTHPQVDIYGGQVFTLPFFERRVTASDRACFGSDSRSIDGVPLYDRTDNFFVGRTRSVAALGWEPRLKLVEHTEFFWRARGRLTTVFDERFWALHARTPFDARYMEKRADVEPYLLLLRELMKE